MFWTMDSDKISTEALQMTMNGYVVHPVGWEPDVVGGRRLRYDVSDLIKKAEDVSPAWVSVNLSTKDAESACRQLKGYANLKYTSKKIDTETRVVHVCIP